MKKILAAALALCMTMGAAALAEGTFRVGVKQDVYGFGYYDEATGEFSGMEIDLGEKLAEALGYDEVEYTAVTAATRGQMLDNDELDCVIATFTIKPERKESWDFSTPYYVDAVTVLVEDESGITDLAGLKDKTVGVSSGSTSAKALAKAMAEAGVIDAFDEDTFDAATFSGGVSLKIFDGAGRGRRGRLLRGQVHSGELQDGRPQLHCRFVQPAGIWRGDEEGV